ncbi:MAG TPA: DUF4349 domain-containing protein [Nocardioides sp.]|nr:DUF4349 domain-containing protein [Nocardioides sp.]
MGAAAVAGLLALGACGAHATSTNDSGGTAASVPAVRRPAAAAPDYAAQDSVHGQLNSVAQVARKAPVDPTFGRRSLIYTGDVQLRSRDVAAAAAGVRRTAAQYGGRIDDEQTQADAGRIGADTLTVRVPSGRFNAAFNAIKGLGRLQSANSSTQDVTTQVIDVHVRVKAQKASLHRIEQLMSRATTLGQVIALESQLTQRQAALDALEQKQAYLKDQTAMSTITVEITHVRTPAATTQHAKHRTGFVGGLHRGWHALVVSATAVSAGVGAVLPFGIPLLVIGVPLWLALRRRRRAPAAPTPAP